MLNAFSFWNFFLPEKILRLSAAAMIFECIFLCLWDAINDYTQTRATVDGQVFSSSPGYSGGLAHSYGAVEREKDLVIN